jgi:hypothetical protein
MQAVDNTRFPTPFQRHVLRVLRAVGPCSLAELRPHCARPGCAVRHAVWLLRRGGFVERITWQRYDVSAAGRMYLNATELFPALLPTRQFAEARSA